MTFTHEIKAEVIADSLSPTGVRLTTLALTYNRFLMPEIMMHRKQTRSSASSRAIPFKTMLERAEQFPAPFVEYPCEQSGMQGGAMLEGEDLAAALDVLSDIQLYTTSRLRSYLEQHEDPATRLHKSVLNRTLEWFGWTTTVLAATEWENYFRQRAHKDAMPEFRELAYKVREAMEASTPKQLGWYEWHLPFIDDERDAALSPIEKIKVSTARCARTSYLSHDGEFSHEADFRMYDNTLATNGHWAPLEHPAVCLPGQVTHLGNFDVPWHQFRHMVEYGGGSTAIAENIIARSRRATAVDQPSTDGAAS